MLSKLTIKNIALIEYEEIDFTGGLNVLSGETGSGKSIILESINFVLGEKADKSLIRSGENDCFVQAEFDLNVNSVKDILDDLEIDNDDLLIISRKFTLDGKNTIRVNGTTVNVTMLRKITSKLVDVHGQSEHFFLLSNANQLKLLDDFCDDSILNIKNRISELHNNYLIINSKLKSYGGDENQRIAREDLLKYQISEIEKANIKDGEEAELLSIREKLRFQEKIITALSTVNSFFTDENGIYDMIGNCVKNISQISNLDDKYSELTDRISSIYAETEDIGQTSKDLLDNFNFSDYDPNEIEIRLDLIKNLKRKYGNSVLEIENYLSNAKTELDELENYDKNTEELFKEKERICSDIFNEFNSLSAVRRGMANEISKNISSELKELGMDSAQFSIAFSDIPKKEDCNYNSVNGFDEISFMFSANKGEKLKNMSEVISGGEMSRLMLSIKAQSSKLNDISTYIFDEIDSGISGNVAKIVAQKFAKISKNIQVIAVTHLPQIASMADCNFLISKYEKDDKTYTSVKKLKNNEKISEIVRLIGGNTNSQVAMEHSKNIIKEAEDFKNSL